MERPRKLWLLLVGSCWPHLCAHDDVVKQMTELQSVQQRPAHVTGCELEKHQSTNTNEIGQATNWLYPG